jgi:hypothetical protein
MISQKNGARCGQFVEDVLPPVLLDNPTQETLSMFVRELYSKKDVKGFIVGMEDFTLLTFEEFFERTELSLAKPYAKKSGSSKCPKKYWDGIMLEQLNMCVKDGALYCTDESRYGEEFVYDKSCFLISKHPNSLGRINKLSRPATKKTYHLEVKLKQDG